MAPHRLAPTPSLFLPICRVITKLICPCLKIGKTSALAMNLTGILKSVLLVFAAILIWGTPITFLQAVGYAIALIGLLLYALPDDTLRQSEIAEIAMTHLGVPIVRLGNRLGLLRLWGTRGGRENGEGRYTSVPDGTHAGEDDGAFLSNGSEGGKFQGEGSEGTEKKEKLASD